MFFTHNGIGDMKVSFKGNETANFTLFTYIGDGANYLGESSSIPFILKQGGTPLSSFVAPGTGQPFQPEDDISSVLTSSLNQTWTLCNDDKSGYGSGIMKYWALRITTDFIPPPVSSESTT